MVINQSLWWFCGSPVNSIKPCDARAPGSWWHLAAHSATQEARAVCSWEWVNWWANQVCCRDKLGLWVRQITTFLRRITMGLNWKQLSWSILGHQVHWNPRWKAGFSLLPGPVWKPWTGNSLVNRGWTTDLVQVWWRIPFVAGGADGWCTPKTICADAWLHHHLWHHMWTKI